MTFSTGTNGTSGTGLDNQGFSPSRFFNFCPVCPVWEKWNKREKVILSRSRPGGPGRNFWTGTA